MSALEHVVEIAPTSIDRLCDTPPRRVLLRVQDHHRCLPFRPLQVKSGFRVGSEHISSLVNTLVLAYAGVSLPLFLFLIINPTNQPLWAILNSEMIVEEIVRTLTGSIGLILAVPITTLLAAWLNTTKSLHKK